MVVQNVSREADEVGLITCICVAGVFLAMRTAARWYKLHRLPLQTEDLFMYLSLASFAITTALYYDTIDPFFRIMALTSGKITPSSWPTMERDLSAMLKEFFAVQFFFWLTLWAVKWSLLFMFKKLTDGLPPYSTVWWCILGYSVLTFVGSCVSNFTSCSSMHAWFHSGECETERDARAKTISLWFSLAADLSTDLLIMIIPIRILFHLRISLLERLSLALVFVVGIITMITAIIRSVSLNSSTASGQVSTTWLLLWAGIECAVAIIVGCLPSFAIFIRSRVNASRPHHHNYQNSWNIRLPTYRSESDKTGSKPRSPDEMRWPPGGDAGSDMSLVEAATPVPESTKRSQRWRREERPS